MSENTPSAPPATHVPRRTAILGFPTEILQMVFLHVGQGDLVKCSTVCKSWYSSSKSLVWSIIGARFNSKLSLNPVFGAVLLTKYAHHFWKLDVYNDSILRILFVRTKLRPRNEWHPWSQSYEFIDLNSPLLTNHRQLSVSFPLNSSVMSPSAKDMVLALLRNSPCLDTLEILDSQRKKTILDLIVECQTL